MCGSGRNPLVLYQTHRPLKNTFLLTLALLLSFASDAQIRYHKTYGAANPEFFAEAQPTADGGFMLAGARKTTSGGQWRILAGKINATGDLLWSKTYQGNDDQSASSMQATLDGNFILAGRSKSYAAGEQDVFLMKMNDNGAVLWSKTYGGPGSEWINTRVIATADSGYLVSAYTDGYGAGSIDCYMVKTDKVGTIEWTRTLGGAGYDYTTEVVELSNGDFIMTGFTSSIGQDLYDVLLTRFTATGDTLWTRSWGRPGYNEFSYGVTPTNDGGFLLAGRAYPGGSSNYQGLLLKTDSMGNYEWAKDYGGSSYDNFVKPLQMSNGNYMVSGYGQSFSSGGNDLYLTEVDTAGTVQWSKHLGTSNNEGGSILPLADGGVLFAGRGGAWPNEVGVVMRLDSTFTLGCDEYSMVLPESPYPMLDDAGLTLGSGGGSNNAPYGNNNHSMPTITLCTSICALAVTTSSTDLTCFNDASGTATASASGESGTVTYAWSNGATLATATGLDAGMHTVLVTDASGCSVSDTVWLAQPAAIATSISGTDVLCFGDSSGSASALATGGTGPFSILWNNGQTGTSANNFPAAIAVAQFTDSVGCIALDSVVIDQPMPLAAALSSTDVLCFGGSTGTASVVASGGSGMLTYLWTNTSQTCIRP